jgi:hypothetical protein
VRAAEAPVEADAPDPPTVPLDEAVGLSVETRIFRAKLLSCATPIEPLS